MEFRLLQQQIVNLKKRYFVPTTKEDVLFLTPQFPPGPIQTVQEEMK